MHAATAFGKHSRRHATLAVTASIGPGALNMVTGAALATVSRLPVLLLPGDTYATRHQGPVLQQLQHPLEADVTVNDAFRPVCRGADPRRWTVAPRASCCRASTLWTRSPRRSGACATPGR